MPIFVLCYATCVTNAGKLSTLSTTLRWQRSGLQQNEPFPYVSFRVWKPKNIIMNTVYFFSLKQRVTYSRQTVVICIHVSHMRWKQKRDWSIVKNHWIADLLSFNNLLMRESAEFFFILNQVAMSHTRGARVDWALKRELALTYLRLRRSSVAEFNPIILPA